MPVYSLWWLRLFVLLDDGVISLQAAEHRFACDGAALRAQPPMLFRFQEQPGAVAQTGVCFSQGGPLLLGDLAELAQSTFWMSASLVDSHQLPREWAGTGGRHGGVLASYRAAPSLLAQGQFPLTSLLLRSSGHSYLTEATPLSCSGGWGQHDRVGGRDFGGLSRRP